MLKRLKLDWQIFCYNFHWADYGWLFTGNLARAATLVPLLGYVILFNDTILNHLSFEILLGNGDDKGARSVFGLSSLSRFRFIYFGLVFLGVGEIAYRLFCPRDVRFSASFSDYKKRVLEDASLRYFIEANSTIRRHQPSFTTGGKYYDRDFEEFVTMASGSPPGTSLLKAYENRGKASWDDAVRRFEPLLTGMMYEIYFREGIKKRPQLIVAIILAIIGYTMLAIPSGELFLRVLEATCGDYL